MLAGPGTRGPGRRPRRVHMRVPADTSGRGLCSGVHLHDRRSSGKADLRPRRPGENWGRLGVTGESPEGSRVGASRGLCGPTGAGPGILAPRPDCVLGLVGAGTPGLGQAQKSPFPDQAPNGGSGDRGGCAEPGVTAGPGASISRRAPSAPGSTTGSCTLRGWALQRDGPRQIVGSSIRACICQCSEGLT